MKVRSLLPHLLGPQLKSLDFTSLRMVADKLLMRSLYSLMAEACPNLERLAMGQSFFFYPQLVSDLNKRLEKFSKVAKKLIKSLQFRYFTAMLLIRFRIRPKNVIKQKINLII